MQRPWKWFDYLPISVEFFAISARAQTLAPLVVPLLVQQFIGEGAKGSAYGAIRLWALMAGLLAQAAFGLVSDGTRSRWGRRRIYIAGGTLAEVLVLGAIGLLGKAHGAWAVWLLGGLYILSMIASNAANAGALGFIPDQVPPNRRGLASGVKVLFEAPLALIFVGLVIGPLVSQGRMAAALGVLAAAMVGCLALTWLVREGPLSGPGQPLAWQPLLRLAAMTALFSGVILGAGAAVRALLPLIERAALPGRLIAAGGTALLAMAAAVGAGVWLALRLSLGAEFKANRSFTWWVINRLAWLTASTNAGGFLLYYLQEKFSTLQAELAAGPVAKVLLITGTAMLVSALAGGWLADRASKRALVAASSLLGALGTFILILAPGLGLVYAGGAVLGLGAGLFYSANWALGTGLVPGGKAGEFLGLSNLAGAGAGAVGAYLGGPLADRFGYELLLVVLALMFVLSNVALAQIREP